MESEGGSRVALAVREFLDPRSLPYTLGRSRGKLPHLVKPGCTYFVTFCLQPSHRAHVQCHFNPAMIPEPDDVARMSEPSTVPAVPLLALPRVARFVEAALLHFQGQRYVLHAWCVMPDHIHVLVTPFEGRPLGEILHSWKSFTANEVNRMLHRAGFFLAAGIRRPSGAQPGGFPEVLGVYRGQPSRGWPLLDRV